MRKPKQMKKIFSIITVIVVLLVCMLGADQGNLSLLINGNNFIDFVSLAIFIFIVYFFVTIKSWSPKAKKEIITAIVVYCCFNVYMVSTNFGIVCIKRSRYSARTKSCWSNIRVIEGAVEMYNMDSASMTSTLNIPELMKCKYLKMEIKGTEPDCHYDSCGDLSKDGFVFCTHHLIPDIDDETLNQFNIGEYTPNDKIPQEMIDKIKQIKTEIEKQKSLNEKNLISLKKNWPKIKETLFPFLILFFPFALHPLR